MPDKRTVCSLTDSVIIDYIPKKTRDVIDKNIRMDEDIKAAVKGITGEALVVTDTGVYTIKEGDKCNYFSYDEISEGKKVSRIYRRGRFEIPLKDKDEQQQESPQKNDGDFGPDTAGNVVNFPWSKVPLFRQAADIIRNNRKIYETKAGAHYTCDDEDHEYECELKEEIKRLNDRLAQLEQARERAKK